MTTVCITSTPMIQEKTYTHIHTENDKTSGKMLTIGESGVQAMQASFVLFVFFRI